MIYESEGYELFHFSVIKKDLNTYFYYLNMFFYVNTNQKHIIEFEP